MKVSIYNYFDPFGGAGRATWRIFQALKQEGVDVSLNIVKALSKCESEDIYMPGGILSPLLNTLRRKIGELPLHLFSTNNSNQHAIALLPSLWPSRINKSDVDIIQLHWVNYEMMSIEDIGRIKKPVVWRLSDMWAFSGAEYYTEDYRWRDGYNAKNRQESESGLDINLWVWKRKLRAWKKPMNIIAPSKWMAECVSQSALMRDWPITFIPNAIDVDVWRPFDKKVARLILGLPDDGYLLCFGAIGGGKNPRKGADLLFEAINLLRGEVSDLHLVVFGEEKPKQLPNLGFPIYYLGHLSDDIAIRILYNAVDAIVIPSRIDNSPNTGVEALSCGTPIVAFNCSGMPDIIVHKKNGWLANAFDTGDMAEGIKWILSRDKAEKESLSSEARNFAVNNFSYSNVANKYIDVYKSIICS